MSTKAVIIMIVNKFILYTKVHTSDSYLRVYPTIICAITVLKM
jgi:hypothetical protein